MQDNTKTFIVRKMLEGMHRSNPTKDTRSPITLDILTQITGILSSVCKNLYETLLFTVAYHLAFFALLRVSELTVSNPHNLSRVISFDDIDLAHSNLVLVRITGSKTDQYGKGATLQITHNKETSTLFSAIHKYKAIRPQLAGPFLCHLNSKPLTSYQFTAVLQKCMRFLGFDTSTFKSHSFRIGYASHLYSTGVSEEEIMSKGRWKSDAFQSYIRL